MELRPAKAIANELIDILTFNCDRIEIAGSIRRGKQEVKDIELVCKPKFLNKLDMFGNVVGSIPKLDVVDWSFIGKPIKNGSRYKQIALHSGINLDLFIVFPPAQWGCQFTIRTGPADFSKWVVASRQKGGALPSNSRVKDGCVYCNGEPIPMPEEIDFLNYLGLGWIEPSEREPEWRRFR